jgi:hypothetical protein
LAALVRADQGGVAEAAINRSGGPLVEALVKANVTVTVRRDDTREYR